MGWRLVTRQGVDLAHAVLVAVGGLQTIEKTTARGVFIKLPAIPLCWSVLSLSLSLYVTFCSLFRNLSILFCKRAI
jgi:hypothetical protein